MTLSEISIAFNNCNGSSVKSFKQYILDQDFSTSDLDSGIDLLGSFNYILGDVEKLVDKSIVNICSADLLLSKGYFNWGFVTSYYSNFFLIQALNRLMLDFTSFNNKTINCVAKNYGLGILHLNTANNSKGSHESQYQNFYSLYSQFKYQKSIDRYWTLGVQQFKMKPEAFLRNIINYQIEKNIYYELDLELNKFNKIIKDNKNYKFDSKKMKVTKPENFAIYNLELALSRLRIALYILNYIANDNAEYKNYFIQRCKKRIKTISEKYPKVNYDIKSLFKKWLAFEEIETEQSIMV